MKWMKRLSFHEGLIIFLAIAPVVVVLALIGYVISGLIGE